jgi:hypothetical protein
MSLRYILTSRLGPSTEITDRVFVGGLDVTCKAEEGSTALSTIVVDDPDGDLDIVGQRFFYVLETSAPSNMQVVYAGYVADRVISRGPLTIDDITYHASGSRIWAMSVADPNSVLERKILTQSDANRGAETDVARMQWASTVPQAGFIDDFTYLNTSSGVAMDALDYRGQRIGDVMNDCIQASGKNVFMANIGPAGNHALWYGANDLAAYSSTIRLSNSPAEIDDVTTLAYEVEGTILTRDPSRVYSGVYLVWDGGRHYAQRTSTKNNFASRDASVPGENVKSAAAASRRAERYLDDMEHEYDRITVRYYVKRSQVTALKEGMRVEFQCLHFPGYEEFVWLRCVQWQCKELTETVNGYDFLITADLTTDSIPAAPGTTTALLEATLTIGSAVYLGLPSDRERHNASDLGLALPTLTVGKQYRLVATVIDCLTTPLHEYDHINSPSIRLWIGEAGALQVTQTNGYNWTPDDGTQTDTLSYQGAGYNFRSPIAQGGTAPNGSYRPGEVIAGEWLTFDGPALEVDMAISGQPLSGFYGFRWQVHVELQERDA